MLYGYITEFFVDYTKSYSVAEINLFKGPRGRYLRAMIFWIKMALCDKGILKMECDN